jgi:hypothetical protein
LGAVTVAPATVKVRLAAEASWAGRAVAVMPTARPTATAARLKRDSRRAGVVLAAVMDDVFSCSPRTPTGLADGFGQGSGPALAAMDARALHPGTAVGPRSGRRLAAAAVVRRRPSGVACVRRLRGARRTRLNGKQPAPSPHPDHGTVTTVTDRDGSSARRMPTRGLTSSSVASRDPAHGEPHFCR